MQALQEFHRPSCIADTTRSHSCSSWAFVIMTAVAPFLPQDRSPFCQVCWLRRRINRCRGFVRVVVAVVGIRNWVEMKVMVIMVVARPLLLAWSVLILKILSHLEGLVYMQVKTVAQTKFTGLPSLPTSRDEGRYPIRILIMFLFC